MWLYYCFRIYDISGSSDEKSEESDKESDDCESKVAKASAGMLADVVCDAPMQQTNFNSVNLCSKTLICTTQ